MKNEQHMIKKNIKTTEHNIKQHKQINNENKT